VEKIRRERTNVILVDAGDLLFSRESAQNPNAKQIGSLKADLYMKAYNAMGYTAFTPGELDLALGLDELMKMSQQAKFPFLAANLIHTRSKEPVFKPYVIEEIQGMKVGLFGLISNRFSPTAPGDGEKFQITDPLEAAKKMVGALRRECRVIIALAHMEADEQKTLAETVDGIHFLINGHLTKAHSDPVLVKRSQIFLAGSRGEYFGQVDLFKKMGRLFSQYRVIPMKPDYQEKPDVQAWVAQYKDQLQCALQPPETADVLAQVKADFSSQISVPEFLSFMGEKSCMSCHPREYEHWQQTAHARAYWTLVERNKASDPTCLPCHTTGYGSLQDPRARFENVQCEACHGPAEAHPNPRKELEHAEEHGCRVCHNPTNSPNFRYDVYVRKIVHPK
jgi:Cytochrome c554 and c-prime